MSPLPLQPDITLFHGNYDDFDNEFIETLIVDIRLSVRRWEGFWFYDLHLLITTDRLAVSCFCTECFGTAFLTFVSFSQLDHFS